MANELAARPNTISDPDSTPGMTCGSTIRRMTFAWLAPSDSAACSAVGSSFCSEVQTGMIMNGNMTWTSAMTTANGVYSSFTGRPPMNWMT